MLQPNDMIVSEYCNAMDRREITVNPKYQRSDKVWPPAARSFLVESIILGYPIPKFYLHQITDLKSKKAIKEIVDGQQRSRTIYEFFHNKLRLSKALDTERARGKTYDQLDADLQAKFLNYRLSIDLFVATSESEIRESFKRLNSYTVPLNAEEKRHAVWQGEFKWFVYERTKEFEKLFLDLEVFDEKQVVRMQDAKLIAEFTYAIVERLATTKSKQLDDLYKRYDREFPQQEELHDRLRASADFVLSVKAIHGGPLMRPYIFLTLLIAVSHALRPVEHLREVFDPPPNFAPNQQTAEANLSVLSAALDSDLEGQAEGLNDFVKACAEKTNVESQRKKRVEWLGRALILDAI